MFDVDLPNGEVYREHELRAGRAPMVAPLPWGGLGLSICYDLRFPIFIAPSPKPEPGPGCPRGLTRLTGEAHWATLLPAPSRRSASSSHPAESHEYGHETFGHASSFPWGEVLAEGGVHPSVIFADIDLSTIGDVRSRVPSLQHDRAFTVEADGKAAAKVSS